MKTTSKYPNETKVSLVGLNICLFFNTKDIILNLLNEPSEYYYDFAQQCELAAELVYHQNLSNEDNKDMQTSILNLLNKPSVNDVNLLAQYELAKIVLKGFRLESKISDNQKATIEEAQKVLKTQTS